MRRARGAHFGEGDLLAGPAAMAHQSASRCATAPLPIGDVDKSAGDQIGIIINGCSISCRSSRNCFAYTATIGDACKLSILLIR